MARIRSIHPSFFTDEAVVSCSVLARYFYIGLWGDADDQGVFEWKPLQLKMRLLPADDADVAALLQELLDVDLIAAFDEGGKRYGAIKDFRTYQRPKKPNATHPLPNQWANYVGLSGGDPPPGLTETAKVPNLSVINGGQSPTGSEPVPNSAPTGGEKPPQMEGRMEDGGGSGGEEGKGAGGKPSPRKRGSRLPADWAAKEALTAYGVGLGFTERQVGDAAERFRLHWRASSQQNAVKLDWDAAFQFWLREDAQRRPPKAGGGNRPRVW